MRVSIASQGRLTCTCDEGSFIAALAMLVHLHNTGGLEVPAATTADSLDGAFTAQLPDSHKHQPMEVRNI